jgi:transaldolase
MEIYRAYDYKTEVLAASLRHPLHVIEAAKMGADIGTMPFKVFEMLFHHPLTDKGLAGFLKDWEKARQTLGDIMSPAAARQAGR